MTPGSESAICSYVAWLWPSECDAQRPVPAKLLLVITSGLRSLLMNGCVVMN